MHILPFKPEYERQVIDLILDIWEKEFGFTGLERPDVHDISNYYQSDKKSNFWVAVEDSEVVGTIALKALGKSEGELKRLAKNCLRPSSHLRKKTTTKKSTPEW